MAGLRFAPVQVALTLGATLSFGCGLVDDGAPRSAAAWCAEEGVTEVTIGQREVDGVLEDTNVRLSDAEGRTLAWIDYPQDGDAGARRTEYRRDAAGNVVEETLDEGADGVVDEVRTTTYDDEGRESVRSIDEGNDGTVDAIGTWDYATPGQHDYAWDADADGDADSLSTETYSDSGQLLRWVHDLDADGSADRIYTYAYTESGQRLEETEDDDDYSAVTTYEYDEDGRLVRKILEEFLPSMLVIADTYEYDGAGLLTAVLSDWDEDGDAEEVWRPTYDNEGRVVRAEILDGSGVLRSAMEFAYDEGPEPVRITHDGDGDGSWESVTTRSSCG